MNNILKIEFTTHDILQYGDFIIFDDAYQLQIINQMSLPIKYLDANVRSSVCQRRCSDIVRTCDILKCSDDDYAMLFDGQQPDQVMSIFSNIQLLIITSLTNVRLIGKKIDITIKCPIIPPD